MNLLFDIETDGLYKQVTQIHCVAIKDLGTSDVHVFNDVGSQPPISRAIAMLEDAETIIAHNGINFDIPVIQKFYPWFTPPKCLDTLLLSRLYHPDIMLLDKKRNLKDMPLQLYGRHSLEAYGWRLGEHKGAFAKQTDWKDWSKDMEDYMVQDVQVTHKLWNHFRKYLNG